MKKQNPRVNRLLDRIEELERENIRMEEILQRYGQKVMDIYAGLFKDDRFRNYLKIRPSVMSFAGYLDVSKLSTNSINILDDLVSCVLSAYEEVIAKTKEKTKEKRGFFGKLKRKNR